MKMRSLAFARPRPSRYPVRAGFTLAEILVTIFIIGLLAAVAAPRFSDAKLHFQIRATAQRIRADLELARSTARSAGVSTSVGFDVNGNRYSLTNVADIDRANRSYIVDLAQTAYSASLVSVSFGPDGTDSVITFDIFGRPNAGGSVLIEAGNKRLTVLVESATGRVTIQ